MLKHVGGITLIVAAALACAGSTPTLADRDQVMIGQAWSRATPKGAKVAGGYLTIANRDTRPDRLLSASSPAAAKVEIHGMTTEDGIMTMRPLDDGLEIPPDATLTLAPGGDHIMFVGLAAPFEEGQRVPVSLTFEHAGAIETLFEVGPVGAKGPRLQIASTEQQGAASMPLVKAAPAEDAFFTHLCGTRVMADVTVTPGRRGPVEVLVQLVDGDERPLAVQSLSVTLSKPDENVAPITTVAERVAADKWRVRITVVSGGKWSLSLDEE